MSTDALTERQRWLSLSAPIAGVLGVGVGFGAMIPLIALRLEQDGVDAGLIGMNSAMSPAAVLLIGPFLPRLIGWLGTLRSMYVALAVGTVAILLFPLLPTLWVWFVLRFVIGLATAVHWVVTETWVNTVASDRTRGRVMGVYATVIAAGFTVGPLIVSLIGIEGWLPFVLVALCIALSAVPLLLARDLAPPLPHRPDIRLWRLVVFAPTVMLGALAAGFIDISLFVMLPVYGLRAGFDQALAVQMLSVFVAGNLVLQMPLGWLADHTNPRTVLIGCTAAGVIGILLLPVLLPHGPLLWIMMFLWGGTTFGLYTVGLTLLGRRFPAAQLAGANTAFVMIYEIGSISGPVISGFAMDIWGGNGLVVTVGTVAAAFLLFSLLRARLAGRDPE
ncbi:MFS transporter [Rhodospirillaceae bacterium SYSU D60014]|uniref:MFS transporter n=1 Tax=Virgifigura deserti TaxID=2268457 RepID=UPI000E66B75D